MGAVALPALLQPLAASLAVGLLIGLQRGWQARDAPPGHRVAGFRTFGLLGLVGGLSTLLPTAFGAVLLAAAAATLVAGYLRQSSPDDVSATGTVVGLITLALGALAAAGEPVAALAAAAVVAALLALRPQLHGFLRGVTPAEIEAATRFAIVALVILPLMPDRAMGPLDAWNPRQLWSVVVLVSGLGFVGYAAARRLGPGKGLLATAAAGALVSSTAVTVSYARQLRAAGPAEGALIAGISLASAVMFARTLLLTGLLAAFALPALALLLAPAILVQLIFVARALRHGAAPASELPALGNPLDVRPALLLAAFVAGLSLLSRLALQRYGDAGVGALLLITGFADVDAAILALAQLPRGLIAPDRAGLLLALPILANTALKAGLAVAIAPNRRGLRAALPLAASLLAAAVAAPLLLGR